MALTKVDKTLLETTSGTADATTFLRGDGTWNAPASGTNTPSFCAYNNTDQALSESTYTLVAANTEVYDTASAYNTSTYIYTVPTAGKYFVFCGGYLKHNHGAKLRNEGLAIYKDGTKDDGLWAFWNHGDVDVKSRYASTVLDLAVDDELSFYIYQTNIDGAPYYTYLQSGQYQNSWGAFKLAGV